MMLGMRFRDVRTVTTMAPLQPLKLVLLLLLISSAALVGASHNVTVDDDDTTQIIYDPPDSWRETPFDPLNAGGRHRVTSDTGATATFTFTGTAVYFYAPLWPFEVTTAVSLDGAPPASIDLIDPATVIPEEDGAETVESQVVWSAEGLDNVEHTLVVSVTQGDDHAIVDTLAYTVLDADDPTPTTSTDDSTSSTSSTTTSSTTSSFSLLPPPAPSTSATSSNSSSPTARKGLSIAIGIVCTVFALLVFYGIYWYWRRRQRLRLEQEEEEEYTRNNPSSPDADAPPMGYAYKKQPSAWQRNSRGRLVAASTGITTTPSTLDNEIGTNGAVRGAGVGTGRRPRPTPPRRHGPSPLSMSSSSSSISSMTGSAGRPKKPLTTIPEMRMREDVDADVLASPGSPKTTDIDYVDRPLAGAGAGSTRWTTFDQPES